jgi:hypothetical protein
MRQENRNKALSSKLEASLPAFPWLIPALIWLPIRPLIASRSVTQCGPEGGVESGSDS